MLHVRTRVIKLSGFRAHVIGPKSTSVKENYWTALLLGENCCRRTFILIRHRDILDGGSFDPVLYVDTNLRVV